MSRKTFFSFHYTSDVWRVWNVRNCWVVKPEEQVAEGFFDSSVFEASKKESVDNLKTFLKNGLKNTSVTCVLAGKETYLRRWVRYEIVRSVLKGNGLLTVHIHNLKDKNGYTTSKGIDPLSCIGVYKSGENIYFAEKNDDKWEKYGDYQSPISAKVLKFSEPKDNVVLPLSRFYSNYDFVNNNGRENISKWIDSAAKQVGR
ncbi:TPA: TIR domain-containing protein [Vibrio parahaemolyticus]|nr:hypothetical protein [Vibrio alginolyticus]HBC3988888.1 TIR domain-containing protein [Vibrio parahaemolyticus]